MPIQSGREPGKSASAFRTISEVAKELDVPAHVLRFWEGKFSQIKPLKRGGGRRYYRPEDIALIRGIRKLLYIDGYTIRGAQKLMRERGVKVVVSGNLATPPQSQRTLSSPTKEEINSSQSELRKTLEIDDANRKELALAVKELELLRDRLKNTLT